ncbi:MAG: nuclear transport factor 2 family protein [Gammaproteobacteria bacterium]
MDFPTLIRTMTAAAVRGDGRAVRACFTPDGVYHDCFYGAFAGDRIVEMIEDCFHRDACNFVWDIHDPIANEHLGYARYVFSYESRLPQAAGRRAGFEGVAVCALRDGLIASYHEVANSLVGLQALGFAPDRLAKLAARESQAFFARTEAAHHRP